MISQQIVAVQKRTQKIQSYSATLPSINRFQAFATQNGNTSYNFAIFTVTWVGCWWIRMIWMCTQQQQQHQPNTLPQTYTIFHITLVLDHRLSTSFLANRVFVASLLLKVHLAHLHKFRMEKLWPPSSYRDDIWQWQKLYSRYIDGSAYHAHGCMIEAPKTMGFR